MSAQIDCKTMVYGLYVIYYGVCFVCGTMVTTVHVHTCVLLSHLCTTVNYCTHLCTTVHTCVQLYTVQYTLVYTRTCILYKCPNVVARHLWSAHVSVLRGRPVCTSGEPGFGKLPSRPHSALARVRRVVLAARGQGQAHLRLLAG